MLHNISSVTSSGQVLASLQQSAALGFARPYYSQKLGTNLSAALYRLHGSVFAFPTTLHITPTFSRCHGITSSVTSADLHMVNHSRRRLLVFVRRNTLATLAAELVR